jgi:hypothetical protein
MNLLQVNDAEIPGLDIRMVRLRIQPLGDLGTPAKQLRFIRKKRHSTAVQLMLFQRSVMGETVPQQILKRLQKQRRQLRLLRLWNLIHTP